MNLTQHLERTLPPGSNVRFGELCLSRCEAGIFSARHCRDLDANAPLSALQSARDLRELAKYDDEGNYRPLKSAPGLKAGWETSTACPREFLKRLDAIYPGVFATAVAYFGGTIDAIPLRETLGRQTGMYRSASAITDAQANEIMRGLCSPGCLRIITWPIDPSAPTSRVKARTGEVPLLCVEACTFAVNRARQLARKRD